MELAPPTYAPDVVAKVRAARMRALAPARQRELAGLWCTRAIRVHLANALGERGMLDAASLARTAPAVDVAELAPAHACLVRIASERAPEAPDSATSVVVALQALGRALDHAADTAEDARGGELDLVASWIGKALLALGIDDDREVAAQREDLGGLSDA